MLVLSQKNKYSTILKKIKYKKICEESKFQFFSKSDEVKAFFLEVKAINVLTASKNKFKA